MNKTVTIAEIAKHFHVPRYKVWEWIRDGELNATKVEDRHRLAAYRVDDAEFEAFKLRWAPAQGEKPQPGALAPTPSPVIPKSRNMGNILTPPEIAKYFRVGIGRVAGWIRSGELRAVNVSDSARPRYRIEESHFEEFKVRNAAITRSQAITNSSTNQHEVKNMGMTLTTHQIAKYLKVRPDRVLAWIHNGELRAVNVSDSARPRYRIEEADFEEFKLRRSSRSAAIPTRRGRPVQWTRRAASRERSS